MHTKLLCAAPLAVFALAGQPADVRSLPAPDIRSVLQGAPTRGDDTPTTLFGTLAPSDLATPSGAYYDRHTLNVQAGELIDAALESEGFDGRLRLLAPDGTAFESPDDAPPGPRRLQVWAPIGGTWSVEATSVLPGQTGRYRLDTEVSGEPLPAAGWPAGFVETGWLGDDQDDTLDSGEFVDVFVLSGHVGDLVTLDVRSEFAPLVALVSPSGEIVRDESPGGRRSELRVQLPEVGSYTIAVTSDAPATTGAYTLKITVSRPSAEKALSVS